MIAIDFSWAIALYAAVSLVLVFSVWVFTRKEKEKEVTIEPKFIWFCSICTYTYINTKEDTISVCPRCGSYNEAHPDRKL
ncbi:MAG: hypothetical protein KJ880_07655 [Candidatus Omnitrophica bacterium]|nr:hypothetical protein [Candidatus Omnitrophota bacterium]MBU1869491.1 hypothetical protein [Candidatus Omnitrophota bacterium]